MRQSASRGISSVCRPSQEVLNLPAKLKKPPNASWGAFYKRNVVLNLLQHNTASATAAVANARHADFAAFVLHHIQQRSHDARARSPQRVAQDTAPPYTFTFVPSRLRSLLLANETTEKASFIS